MCAHVEDHCRLQVPGLDENCPAQCEELLTEEEVECLSGIACTMEEVDRCLGRGDPCPAICELVYDQCGQEIVYGKGAAIEREDCEAICPLLDQDYRRCLAEAQTCPEVTACHQKEPEPTACELMCGRVYDFCGEIIDQPGRRYQDRAACEAACGDEEFSGDEVDCLTRTSCRDLETCFEPSATACELMCEKVYDECNYAFPVGAKKEDKVDKDRCVSDCERGKFSSSEMSCVEEESCEYLATCFDDVSRSCASACYWAYNHCDVELGITFGCMGGTCPQQCWMPPGGHQVWFEGEGSCFDYCEFGYQYEGICSPRTVAPWSSQRKSCYRDVTQGYDYHQCKPAVFNPMDVCDAYDPPAQ